MTDDERRALVADLVVEVMGLEMPCPHEPTPSGGTGRYWKVGDRFMHDNDEHIGVAIGVFWDHWRRLEARRIVEERGPVGRAGAGGLGRDSLRVGAAPVRVSVLASDARGRAGSV